MLRQERVAVGLRPAVPDEALAARGGELDGELEQVPVRVACAVELGRVEDLPLERRDERVHQHRRVGSADGVDPEVPLAAVEAHRAERRERVRLRPRDRTSPRRARARCSLERRARDVEDRLEPLAVLVLEIALVRGLPVLRVDERVDRVHLVGEVLLHLRGLLRPDARDVGRGLRADAPDGVAREDARGDQHRDRDGQLQLELQGQGRSGGGRWRDSGRRERADQRGVVDARGGLG